MNIVYPAMTIILSAAIWFAPNGVQLQKEAVERGYALHCPDSGDWAWVGECKEDGGE